MHGTTPSLAHSPSWRGSSLSPRKVCLFNFYNKRSCLPLFIMLWNKFARVMLSSYLHSSSSLAVVLISICQTLGSKRFCFTLYCYLLHPTTTSAYRIMPERVMLQRTWILNFRYSISSWIDTYFKLERKETIYFVFFPFSLSPFYIVYIGFITY